VSLPMTPGLLLLLVDDDDNDLTLFRAAVGKANLPLMVDGVSNGQRAIEYLEDPAKTDRLPDIVILDLHMPLKNGLDFLHWRQSSPFARIPVIVFTGLEDLGERRRALACGANLVLEKPLKFQELVELVRNIGSISLDNEKVTSCSVSHA